MAKLSSLVNPSLNEITGVSSSTSASWPKASYFIPSYNTSSTFGGCVFLDSEFNKLAYATARPYYGSASSFESYEGTNETMSSLFNGMSTTQSNQSSNGGYYSSGLWNGEYPSILMGSSRGTMQPTQTWYPTTSTNVRIGANTAYVNSDHSRKDRTVMLYNGVLTSTPLRYPWWSSYDVTLPQSVSRRKDLTSSIFPSGTAISSMSGSASYNNVRKELVVMAYNSNTTGRFDVAIWKNVDWDLNGADVSLLGSPDKLWNVITPSWQTTNNESQYNIKPVLVDNGDIYYSVMYPSNGFYLYKITRAGDDNSGTVTNLTSQSLTTSYGKDQGTPYGQKAMSTRLGNMVITYCPYYYYACGLRSFIIDKRNSNWNNGRQSTSSSYGMNPLKYRDDSFAFIEASNYYADNYSAISSMGFASPSQTAGGQPVINTNSWYLPIAPGPNTTNYVGVYQVWDYDLLSIPPAYSGRTA